MAAVSPCYESLTWCGIPAFPGPVPASGSQAGYRAPEISPRHSPDQIMVTTLFLCDDFIYRQHVDHKSSFPASSEALSTLKQRTRSKSTSGLTQKSTRPSGDPIMTGHNQKNMFWTSYDHPKAQVHAQGSPQPRVDL